MTKIIIKVKSKLLKIVEKESKHEVENYQADETALVNILKNNYFFFRNILIKLVLSWSKVKLTMLLN